MDVAIVSHSIHNILRWTNSLKPLVNRLSGIDIDQINNNLIEINDKVKEAKQNHFHGSEEILPWLQKVKEIIIDFNDLMEDIHQKEINTSTVSLFRWVLSIRSRVRVTFQVMKAAENIKTLTKEAKGFLFSVQEERTKFEHHVFEKITMVGRENEKKEIIDQLLKLKISVVVIVGGSGIGKTKLARLICEDQQVKSHFDFPPIWIDSHHETFHVSAAITGKRRLLVLDDLRIEIKLDLEKLQQKLIDSGGAGSAILITTCSHHVANTLAGFASRFVLKGLNEHESRLLFQQIRGTTSTSTNNKQDIEWEIVKDCGGVPLWILIIATLMKNHSGGGDLILEAKQIADVETKFLQEVESIYYDYLPTHQKLCFALCSLFSSDYLIDAERLTQLWTAEGFLTIPYQQLDRACFQDFVSLVFHQEEENGVYRMSRLMHKLAKIVAGDENIIVDSMGEVVKEVMLRASFDFGLDLSCGIPDSVFEKAKKLRTILLSYKNTNNPRLPHEVKMTTSTCDKIFNTFKSLRVLDLHDLGIKVVPTSIQEMKYLRYLDLSHNNIEKLPSCITKLIHLQTLKLSYCHVLKELPRDLQDLAQLKHLDIEGCLDLTHMPAGINNLTSLQTLSLFVASKKHVITTGLRELADLNNLRGNLEILHLEQVKFYPSNEGVNDEILKNKRHLQHLTLRWDHDDDEEKNDGVDIDNSDEKLLECLQPHPSLEVLFVVGYNGHSFSNWLVSLQCLVKFTLNDCHKCISLPPMDHLPLLKVLHLRRLNSLEFISKNSRELEVGSTSSTRPIFFPSLKELTISDCPNLKSWWENDEILKNKRPSFTCISKVSIRCCPKLACMPLCTDLDEELVLVDSNLRSMRETETTSEAVLRPLLQLKSMVIERIEESPPQSWLMNFILLEKLHIRDCFNLKSLPQGFKSLSSLKSLSIERCQEFDLENSEGEWEGLKNLHSLTLRSIPKLKSLTQGIGNVLSLKDITIYDCHALTSLPESIGNLTLLEKLFISECRNLDSLPKGMEKIESLHTLIIVDCPLLLPRCQPDTGDDWPQIAHIKNKLVRETPQDLRD
ncbi:unnamed protein product [Lathyrus oleraceus]